MKETGSALAIRAIAIICQIGTLIVLAKWFLPTQRNHAKIDEVLYYLSVGLEWLRR